MYFINKLRINALCCIFFMAFAQTAHPMFLAKHKPPTTASQKKAVAGEVRPVILASEQTGPHTPVVDDSHIYWISDKSSRLIKVGKKGGTPIVLASVQDGIYSIAVDETAVYFATDTKVMKVDKNGGAPLNLSTRNGQTAHITVDKNSVYWLSLEPTGHKYNLMKVGKGGGTPVTLTGGLQAPVSIIADETSIYWYDYADDTLAKVNKEGGTHSILAKFVSGHSAIATDEASIYCANVLGEVKQVSKNGGQPIILASGQGYIKSMAVDQVNIYLATDTRIKKIDKARGAPLTLISGQDLYKIAIDAEAVYWTNDRTGTVMKIVVNASGKAQGNLSPGQRTSSNSKLKGQTIKLSEQGMSLTLPTGWRTGHKVFAGDDTSRWSGPGSTKLAIWFSKYDPKYGIGSIEKETNDFYEDHKKGGSIDVQLLEIGGVRGVHYLVDDESSKERTIFWVGQYVYKGERQVVFVNLSSPSSRFNINRDSLYGILHSIKFIKD